MGKAGSRGDPNLTHALLDGVAFGGEQFRHYLLYPSHLMLLSEISD
jgi:hypothetical protein